MATKKKEAEVVEPTGTKEVVPTRTQKEIQSVVQQSQGIIIVSNETYIQAGEQRQVIKGLLKRIDDLMDPVVKAAHEAHKVAVNQKKSVAQPLMDADLLLMRSRLKWEGEVERKRIAEENRLRQEAEERERDRQLAEAARLAESGDVAAASELLDEPLEIKEVVKVESSLPSMAGFSGRTTWRAEVVDLKALVKAVAEGRAPIECLEANQVFLNRQATAFRGALQIDGVRAVSNKSETVRGI